MVDQPPIGIDRLRVSLERLPVELPSGATIHLPGAVVLPLFAAKIPGMIISYADAAAFMLADGDRGEMSYKRVGLALPHGMTGRKERP